MRRHFSLIEILIVTSLLATIVSLLQPSLSNLVSHSFKQQCQLNLKSIHHAITLYTHDHDGSFPGPSFVSQSPRYLRKRGRREILNDNTARYLYPYLETATDQFGHKYIPQYICPQNADMDLKGIPAGRIQYRALHIRGVGLPFGYPRRKWSRYRTPLLFHAIKIPSKSVLLTDADRINSRWVKEGFAPDEPLHENRSRNLLFADGHIEQREIPKK